MIQMIHVILRMVGLIVEVSVFSKTFLKAVEALVFHHALMGKPVLTLIQQILALCWPAALVSVSLSHLPLAVEVSLAFSAPLVRFALMTSPIPIVALLLAVLGSASLLQH